MEPDEEKDDSFQSMSDRTRRGSEENGLRRDGSYEREDSVSSLNFDGSFARPRQSQRASVTVRPPPKLAEIATPREKTATEKWRDQVAEVMESRPVSAVMSVFTLYSLYEDDIRLLAASKEDDPGFLVMISVCFFLFLMEICLLVWAKPGYFCVPKFREANSYLEQHGWTWQNAAHAIKLLQTGSFDFWLDMVATFTLLMQMTWIIPNEDGAISPAQIHIALAGRAARIGARSARVVRIVRMIHFAHLVKRGKGNDDSDAEQEIDILDQGVPLPPPLSATYSDLGLGSPMASPTRRKSVESSESASFIPLRRRKSSSDSHRGSNASSGSDSEDPFQKSSRYLMTDTNGAAPQEPEEDNQSESQSRIGAAMSDSTTRRVIALIILILVVAPLITPRTSDHAAEFSVKLVHDFGVKAVNDTAYQDGLDEAVQLAKQNTDLLRLVVGGQVYVDKHGTVRALRPVEKLLLRYHTEVDGSNFVTKAVIDRRPAVHDVARYGIGLTTIVLVVLILGSLAFIADVDRLVILPIETMVKLVQKIADDPLRVDYSNENARKQEGFQEGMETSVLLETINKVGSLMRVGFGEAGAAIIARNLKSGSKLELASGTKIRSIFGFCDIRNFTDTTECLQEEVMLFVNRIAYILHGIVAHYNGTANKNIGDAFLLTWKLDEKQTEEVQRALADQALLSFLRTLIEINRYKNFVCDFSKPAADRLRSRFEGGPYQVKMGFGLHVGWAIEGAIGSKRKIDASYISPHVNMTEFLESSTKQYGCTILMSEPFFQLLTDEAKQCCRQVDCILKPDIAEGPIGLFTYDVDPTIEFQKDVRYADSPMRPAPLLLNPRASTKDPRHAATPGATTVIVRQERQERQERQPQEPPTMRLAEYDPASWAADKELLALRRRFTDTIRRQWVDGIDAYLKGEWEDAKVIFNKIMGDTQKAGRTDGPAARLFDYICMFERKPEDWSGYRKV